MVGLWILGLLVGVPLLAVIAGQLGAFTGSAPATLGWRDGRLKPPSSSPNSVSSQANLYPDHPQRAYAAIEPFAPGPDPAASMRRLRELVAAVPGARIIEARDDYLRAEFRTRLMGYVDDLEFAVDPAAGVIQVRSASRLGRKDFGVNRARVEFLRRRFTSPAALPPG
jgi:uncharacterized protein (DUF1499 family)